MLYNICGLNVFYEPKYPRTRLRSEKYLSEDQTETPDIVIEITDERIKNYIDVFPYVSKELAEYGILGAVFCEKILDFNGILLHSSAISVDGQAYLFTADSGTGKSTHTKLWLDYFGDRAEMINDDKPVVRIIDGKIYACGTPFSGKYDINKNVLVPLKAICCINQGKENVIEKITPQMAISTIMAQTLRVEDKGKMLKLFDTLDTILKNTSLYRLYCDISREAVTTSYNAMR